MTTEIKLFEMAHEGKVSCLKIVDKWIVSCGDNTFRFWNLTNGEEVNKLQLLDECRNFDLDSKRTRLAVAHKSGVDIWDFAKRTKLAEIKTDEHVNDVRFNDSGTKLIIGEYSGQISRIYL